MKNRILTATLTVAVLAGVGLIAPTAASAAESEDQPTSTRVETTMYVTGYDEAVARANGYEIITYDDGSWESVAVTEQAKAENAETGIMTPQRSLATARLLREVPSMAPVVRPSWTRVRVAVSSPL
ncbi:hypothetical protein [Microbacterium rhizomatis]|uniref:Uncharacterized protein n=1 Tax=Microbacterium rhizomatis TaxID=1631477 RepID=A0A5J5IXF1_9MICO|nr:hypothetical protein [Microbacterium rhizomatis]KAA9105980.1 hypothetical protein F6B43_16605 [Microbacterium rhizomatis]